MSAQYRYAKIGVSVIAWTGVLLAATFWSHTSVVIGQSSWGFAILLGLLVCIAVMADPLSNHMVSFWIKNASHTAVPDKTELGGSRAMAEVNAFMMRLAQTLSEARSYFVYLFMSCKKMSRHLMSSGSHL